MRGDVPVWLSLLVVLVVPLAAADQDEGAPSPDADAADAGTASAPDAPAQADAEAGEASIDAGGSSAQADLDDAEASADAGAAQAEASADPEQVAVDAAVEAPAPVAEAEQPIPWEVHEDVAMPTAGDEGSEPASPAPPSEDAGGQGSSDSHDQDAHDEDVGEAEPEDPSPDPVPAMPAPGDLIEAVPALPAQPDLALHLAARPVVPAAPSPSHADEAPPAPDPLTLQNEAVTTAGPGVPGAPALLALGATAAAGILLVPGVRHALAALARAVAAMAFFTRVRDHEVLDHPRRRDITEYVRNHPGERLEIVRRDLGLSNGAMLHHLKILDHHDQVRVHRDGAMARLYPAGPRIQPQPYLLPQRRQLLDRLRASPGITQRELAATAGLSERAVSYHVTWLTQQGLLLVERAGTSKRCFPSAAVAAPTA